jgi:hypothetical protein
MNFNKYDVPLSLKDFLEKYPDWEKADLTPRSKKALDLYYIHKYPLTKISALFGYSSRQVAIVARNKAIYELDIWYGYIENPAIKKKEFIEKVKKFRGTRSKKQMARHFGIKYTSYLRIENEDIDSIPDEYYRIFAEALQK